MAESPDDPSAPEDRRPGPRAESRAPIELRVEYKRLNAFFADYTRNISRGGTFIKTERPLEVGTEFVFKLHVPELPEPLSLTGAVVWVRTTEDIDAAIDAGSFEGPREPGMGIRFVFASDDDRRALERRVEGLMVDSLGQLIYSRLMEQRDESQPPGALSPDGDLGADDERQ